MREEVDRVYDRVSKHRLMEYNNDAGTSLADVHKVLLAAEDHLKQRLRPNAQGSK